MLLDLTPDSESEIICEFPTLKMLSEQFSVNRIKGINVGSNHIVSLKSTIFPQNLMILNVSNNNLKDLKGIERCVKLKVLNIGYNSIECVE